MEKIKKYVERFFKKHKKNLYYGMYLEDLVAFRDAAEENVENTIVTVFDYGYAKGYRAAVSGMKGGAV